MKQCDWCQEESPFLTPIVNRDTTVSRAVDLVCSACHTVERFEHADEILWNPFALPKRNKRVPMSASLDIDLAS